MRCDFFCYAVLVIVIYVLTSCTEMKKETEIVSVVCIRDSNSLLIKIANPTKDTIFIPSEYTGIYNSEGDSVFLEVIDKPKYSTDYYYRYRNIFPYSIYTTSKIEGVSFDTVIKIVHQTYFFNQFRVRPFLAIAPESFFIDSVFFDVPKRAGVAKVVYYKKSFANFLGRDSLTYLLEDFVRFDSLNANCIYSKIYNRFYVN